MANGGSNSSRTPPRRLENDSPRPSYALDGYKNEGSSWEQFCLAMSTHGSSMSQGRNPDDSAVCNSSSGIQSSAAGTGPSTHQAMSSGPRSNVSSIPHSNLNPLHDLEIGQRQPGSFSNASVAYTEHTTTTAKSDVPPLTFSEFSVPSSRFKASTWMASAVSGIPIADINEPGSGPQQNGRLYYECPFQFLRCREYFLDKEAWKTHALSHFMQKQPPAVVECPLCAPHPNPGSSQFKDDLDSTDKPIPGSAWHKRMEHVAVHHELGFSLASARPEFDLYDFLWRRKIINEAAYRSLKGRMKDSKTMNSAVGGRRQDGPNMRFHRG